MRRFLTTAAAYAAALAAGLLLYRAVAGSELDTPLVALLALLHLGVGYASGRSHALVLPVLPLVTAGVVADGPFDGLAVFVVLVLCTVPGIAAVATGLVLRTVLRSAHEGRRA